MDSIGNFYLDAVRGSKCAEIFHGTVCVFALLEKNLNEYLKPHKLTPVKFNTLMLIKHKGGEQGLTQNEISQHLIVSPSNMTRLLDGLVKEGYVNRHPSQEDRRVNYIQITPQGSDLLDQVWPGYVEIIRETGHLLEEKEIDQLSDLLLKWYSKLDQWAPKDSSAIPS